MRRAIVICVIIGALGAAAPAHARPYWKIRLDRLARGHSIGIALHDKGRVLYERDARTKRAPASNEKLLLSMALFDKVNPNRGIATRVFGNALRIGGVVTGDVWLSGQGDPSISTGGTYGRQLPFRPTKLGALARAVKDAGITEIRGRVMGNTGYFKHDWFAPGWRYYFPGSQVALPTALTFNGNIYGGRAIRNPEYRAAAVFTRKLEAVGVDVQKRPGSGWMSGGKAVLAEVRSRPLATLVRYMNRTSSNFFAEVLGKRLGAATRGAPGTIAKGGNAIERFAARVGVTLTAKDGSGLSYRNRVSPRGMT
ncbi:MAG: D-alanyl-D-alanine carboxypeptidase, partial [bacterium]